MHLLYQLYQHRYFRKLQLILLLGMHVYTRTDKISCMNYRTCFSLHKDPHRFLYILDIVVCVRYQANFGQALAFTFVHLNRFIRSNLVY